MRIYRPPRDFIIDRQVVIPNPKNGYYTMNEAADKTNVSYSCIKKHVKDGSILSIRFGRQLFIHSSELEHISSFARKKHSGK